MNKIEIYVSGMHCTSCEILLEKSIKKLPNINKVEADAHRWILRVYYNTIPLNLYEIEKIILENGYFLWKEKKLPWLNSDNSAFLHFFLSFLVLSILVFLFSLGVFPDVSKIFGVNSTIWIAPLFIGVAAGFSSCIAMVGGLILGLSAKWNEARLNTNRLARFIPHIWINVGRIIGFAFFGAILGLVGSSLQISTGALGILTILIAIVMFFLGINLTELSPRFSKISFTLPKIFGAKIGSSDEDISAKGAFLLGALTFFLPCGFTFAMQLAAIQSGSAFGGSLILGLFALGTAPGLLGIGWLTSLLKGQWAKIFLRFTGVIVLFMAFYNLHNGLNLTPTISTIQLNTSTPNQSIPTKNLNISTETIKLTYLASGLSDQNIILKKGKNYKIIIDVKTTISGCMNTILIPGLDENVQNVDKGNTIEFNVSATETGKFPITCAMGLSHGSIIVE